MGPQKQSLGPHTVSLKTKQNFDELYEVTDNILTIYAQPYHTVDNAQTLKPHKKEDGPLPERKTPE